MYACVYTDVLSQYENLRIVGLHFSNTECSGDFGDFVGLSLICLVRTVPLFHSRKNISVFTLYEKKGLWKLLYP